MAFRHIRGAVWAVLLIGATSPFPSLYGADEPSTAQSTQVSYYRDIRPIFQANCQGCHQPARASGQYVMTAHKSLLTGGESDQAAIVPGKPEESHLIAQITPADGKAAMPPNKPALSERELELITRWIREGAENDTPEGAIARYDMDHPPVYTRPPVITSLDYSPDGHMLAVAGFHEVLLLKPDGSELLARLVGLSERIETVAFSPDGKWLAVTGGLPGRMGEVQIWDVAERKLQLSVPVTFDTVYGGSWSPDGKLIAFGCTDNTVRAINAETGEQVLFQGAHNDWVLATDFSTDSSHLMSAGRDMTCKLTEVATERFIDNITSITPGALKGGIGSLNRHPDRDEIVIGGADGVPKIYRIYRETARKIGDDANLIRSYPGMTGRIFDVEFSLDGNRFAACSSLDGAGWLNIYSCEFDTSLNEEIKMIVAKRVADRSPEEIKKLDEFRAAGARKVAETSFAEAGVFGLAFSPDGAHVAVGGTDGEVRIVDATSGEVVKQFSPAPMSADAATAAAAPRKIQLKPGFDAPRVSEQPPATPGLKALEVSPAEITLNGPFRTVQLQVSGHLEGGRVVDLTRASQISPPAGLVEVTPLGLVRPIADGSATLTVAYADQRIEVPVTVFATATSSVDFVQDVAPVLSRLGCNQGTCHGAAKGKNGFKLSLRGYDPIEDVRALTDDLGARRINLASPDDSLMLLKPSGVVPHMGGVLMQPGEPYYEILRRWISDGVPLVLDSSRVAKIEIQPTDPVVEKIGGRQQMRVLATYADGTVRDVTREAYIESGNREVAESSREGLMTAIRRGEAPVLARYEGAYAATTLTVMGDRTGFVWEQPETWGTIDELVAAKWERMKIAPSGLTSDEEFLRRVYLDLTGLPPTTDAIHEFLADQRPTREKRDAIIDKLVGSEDYIVFWTNKWADLLQVNRKFLGTEGASQFREWIRARVADNVPYDQFSREILTASGSNRENPAASYYKILRDPVDMMENTTHLFLGVRFNCNKCHDHPFERWTQDQYYETAAYFARVDLKPDPESGNRKIGGTAVEGAKPLYEIVTDRPAGEVKHERTGAVTPPEFPFDCKYSAAEDATRRDKLAAWVTSPDNPYFAKSYVNRLWGYLTGVGLIEPLDDIRAGNPPTNPELLNHLTDEFIKTNFDVRHIMRLICKSRTYQLQVGTNRWNEDDTINYSHATARRLPAEVLYDAIHRATGAVSSIPGVPDGTRAAALPDAGVELPSGFLAALGRPSRESACECERTNDVQLGPIMALVNGPTVGNAIGAADNAIAKLVASEPDNRKLIDKLFLRVLNRHAQPEEIEAVLSTVPAVSANHEELVLALKQRQEFVTAETPKWEAARQQRIDKATAELKAYEAEIAPRVAEQEKQKAEKTAKLEADLAAYRATLSDKLADWEKQQNASVPWTLLDPQDLKASSGAKLEKQADSSIVASEKDDKGTYIITVKTDLPSLTAFRLEALTEGGLLGKGPGLADNGNFVVTELVVEAAPASDPEKFQKLAFSTADADFTQESFDIKKTFDGQEKDQSGWAVSPAVNMLHWATFQLKEPVTNEGGTVLRFTLHQFHNAAKHRLARFRLAATAQKEPVGLSLPEELKSLLAKAAEERSDQERADLLKYYGAIDQELIKKQAALAESRKPLPIDPKLKSLQESLEIVSRPLPEDPTLVQLRQDVETSQKQVENTRLTVAQDLTWALINNPSFLFNR